MLIEFSVSNFRSFKDKSTFSLVKSMGKELPNNAFKVTSPSIKELDLLKTAVIYGANASGKSNFLDTLPLLKEIITTPTQRGDKLRISPFRLDKRMRNKPSEFELMFIVDGVRYQYGFSATQEQIHEEWLFAYPKGQPQKWFERTWDPDINDYHWQFSSLFKGSKQVWKESTRNNALFLSTAVQLNSEQLKPLFDWFDNILRFGGATGFSSGYSAHLCATDNSKEEILKFLQAADLNINDINIEQEEFNPYTISPDMPEELKKMLLEELKDKRILKIKTVHLDTDEEPVQFDLNEESEGTQKLFNFAGPWIDTLKHGYVLFIDELHNSLHPKLVQFLVEQFNSSKTNPKNAQLIFTTHETSILNQDIFRRDQVWFCERSQNQASSLYPLSDFSPLKGKENLELAYLSGRYGALPFIPNFDLE